MIAVVDVSREIANVIPSLSYDASFEPMYILSCCRIVIIHHICTVCPKPDFTAKSLLKTSHGMFRGSCWLFALSFLQ